MADIDFDIELIKKYDIAGPRYTSYPTAVQFNTQFTEADYRAQAEKSNASGRDLSLYFHLPFCDTICYYCACNKVITKDRSKADPYLHNLHREIALQSQLFDRSRKVNQLHWGGGTPTFISHAQMAELMQVTRQHFNLHDDDSGEYSRFYVDSIDDSKVVENTIEYMLHELDPHSSYLSKEELEELNEQLEGEFEGIGVSFNILEDTIYIIRAISGGPSERVGIRAGDRIVKVEGENVAGTGITTREVQGLLKGPKGTRVGVSVHRRGKANLLEFNITRDKIPVFSLDASYMVNDRIGYVKLARFSHTTVDEFENSLKELRAEGMEDLILDLSGNGGGWLPVAVELADHFLSGTKEIVRTEGTKIPPRNYKSRKPGLFEEGRLVIMIDGNSASASEIVSGAIQDWDRGVIVGRRSFGKGLVQQPFYLSDGSMIRLTVARYYTPTGRLIQKSYEDGYEEYTHDLIDRYNNGELSSADSIEFPESQRFRTLSLNRTVYGGGGIMPDYFVPVDTTDLSEYYRALINKGIFNRFILQYEDDHRDEYLSSYANFEVFNREYEPTEEQLGELIEFARAEELPFDEEDWNVSRKQIALLFKSYMARDLWGMGYFYEVYNRSNEVFKKAFEILENPSLHNQKLAKVEI